MKTFLGMGSTLSFPFQNKINTETMNSLFPYIDSTVGLWIIVHKLQHIESYKAQYIVIEKLLYYVIPERQYQYSSHTHKQLPGLCHSIPQEVQPETYHTNAS